MAVAAWKLTLDEYVAKYGRRKFLSDIRRAFFALNHRAIVRQALMQGKPVPPNVLADYRILAKRYRLLKD